ncbi:phosphatidate cytidylyltransferase [Halomonas borealis]|uniref:phosphatidate cytidylyltransferase n=1 Tax=Halomonas borealis TaxID=2508710 RepID=UPI00109FD265|nr:phosphatidate cytidylyltransferase [Halomonas borealis]
MLKQRIITAAWLAPLALAGLFGLSGSAFSAFTAAIVLLAAWEWANLAGLEAGYRRLAPVIGLGLSMALLGLIGQHQASWPLWLGALGWLLNLYWVIAYPERLAQWHSSGMRLAMGLWVLLPTWVGFNVLRETGGVWLLFVLLLVWGADIGAYFVGKSLGRRKLAPSVSPGKTREGVFGGLVVAELLALVFADWQGLAFGATLALLAATAVVALASVVGDLLESMLKRHRGLKDSSRLLPGHGGVLDRIDSLCAAVPLFALLQAGGFGA